MVLAGMLNDEAMRRVLFGARVVKKRDLGSVS